MLASTVSTSGSGATQVRIARYSSSSRWLTFEISGSFPSSRRIASDSRSQDSTASPAAISPIGTNR